MFHRRFGEITISPSSIRRIYLKHKIKYKGIKRGKREIDFNHSHFRSLFLRMRSLLMEMHESKTQVVFLDEIMFTFSTFRSKAWAHNRDRIQINESDLKVKTLAVIAAISEEGGLIDYCIHPKSINTETFVAFIE